VLESLSPAQSIISNEQFETVNDNELTPIYRERRKLQMASFESEPSRKDSAVVMNVREEGSENCAIYIK
jgi:hypothetical protein